MIKLTLAKYHLNYANYFCYLTSKKRKKLDGGGSGTRRDIPTDPAALARSQEILRNAVPLPCGPSDNRARSLHPASISSRPAVVRATRVKSEEFDGGDEDDEEILSRPTPMNVLVKSNTGLVPRNLCLKELHQVSRGEHKNLFSPENTVVG